MKNEDEPGVTVIELAQNESAIVISPNGGRLYMAEEDSDEAEEARWMVTMLAHAARSEVVDARLYAYLNERVTRLMLAMEAKQAHSSPLLPEDDD